MILLCSLMSLQEIVINVADATGFDDYKNLDVAVKLKVVDCFLKLDNRTACMCVLEQKCTQ